MLALWDAFVKKLIKKAGSMFKAAPSKGQTTTLLLVLPAETPVFGLLSVPELLRLRATCSKARTLVDSLPVWSALLCEMDEINRFNVSPYDREPFILRARDEPEESMVQAGGKDAHADDDTTGLEEVGNVQDRSKDDDKDQDHTYNERIKDFTGFASGDPRIKASFASLKPFDKCALVCAFTRAAVERIQKHLPFPPERGAPLLPLAET